MSNSSLVDYIKISPNKTSPRNHVIDTITIHCVVGQLSVETIGNIFAPSSAQASSNYGVGFDGRIGMYVEEKDRSWCTGGIDRNGNAIRVNGISGKDNDHRAITIEVACDPTHPYTVNDKAYKALVELCADICKRNNIKELKWQGDKSLVGWADKQNMTVHRWFANKACPGDYLYNLHSQIAQEVNSKIKKNEEELTMTQYEELKNIIASQNKKIDELSSQIKKLAPIYYDKVEDCPLWSQPYVNKAIEIGLLKGDENGNLRLTDVKIYALILDLRDEGIME